jgi:hypothetical protein
VVEIESAVIQLEAPGLINDILKDDSNNINENNIEESCIDTENGVAEFKVHKLLNNYIIYTDYKKNDNDFNKCHNCLNRIAESYGYSNIDYSLDIHINISSPEISINPSDYLGVVSKQYISFSRGSDIIYNVPTDNFSFSYKISFLDSEKDINKYIKDSKELVKEIDESKYWPPDVYRYKLIHGVGIDIHEVKEKFDWRKEKDELIVEINGIEIFPQEEHLYASGEDIYKIKESVNEFYSRLSHDISYEQRIISELRSPFD